MASYTFERIGNFDNYFLLWETSTAYMHIAGTYTFDAKPLQNEAGGIDVSSIKAKVMGGLDQIPRYRQKIAYIGSKSSPVWIDDDKFNIDYHIRHTSLPRPGTMKQLKELSANIMQQPLDRSRPLWEIWVIEGLEDDKFAFVAKVHHCMVDGISGLELLTILMDITPEVNIKPAKPYIPRPKPTRKDLAWDSIKNAARLPFTTLETARRLKTDTDLRDSLKAEYNLRARGVAAYFTNLFKKGSLTPLNHEIGPHRHFDWISMPLPEVKTVHRALGASLNDVVLAVVSGAVQRFLKSRQVDINKIDFRIFTPVSVQKQSTSGALGNSVSGWTIALPLKTTNPVDQLNQIVAQTKHLKETQQALGAQTLTQMSEYTPATLLSIGAKHHYKFFPWNMVVTNVPGAPIPIYLNGCEMLDAYPHVPLLQNHGLNIALLSYNGNLFWCFNADYDLLPDLDQFAAAVQEAFDVLKLAATPKE